MRPARLALLLLAACSGKPAAPCAGAACPQVAGTYDARVTWAGAAPDGGACAGVGLDLLTTDPFGRVTLRLDQDGAALRLLFVDGNRNARAEGTLLEDGTARLGGEGAPGSLDGADGGARPFTDAVGLDLRFSTVGVAAHLAGTLTHRIQLQGPAPADCPLVTTLEADRR